eukprot:308952-Pelagomonas_calceolata.AAC.8
MAKILYFTNRWVFTIRGRIWRLGGQKGGFTLRLTLPRCPKQWSSWASKAILGPNFKCPSPGAPCVMSIQCAYFCRGLG